MFLKIVPPNLITSSTGKHFLKTIAGQKNGPITDLRVISCFVREQILKHLKIRSYVFWISTIKNKHQTIISGLALKGIATFIFIPILTNRVIFPAEEFNMYNSLASLLFLFCLLH